MAIVYRVQTRRSKRRPARMVFWALFLAGLGVIGQVYWKHNLRPGPRDNRSKAEAGTSAVHRAEGAGNARSTNPTPVFVPIAQTLAPPATNRDPRIPDLAAESRFERGMRVQVGLVRRGISPGSLDGILGSQTSAALRAFQQMAGIPITGRLDTRTWQRLYDPGHLLYTNYMVTREDLARLQPVGETWLAKSQQTRLEFETILELLAEQSQSNPKLVRALNPGINWTNVSAGTWVRLPQAEFPAPERKAAFLKILLAERALQVFDESTNLVCHFPCSIAQRMEKRPVGQLQVSTIAMDPNYTFDPEVFPESAEGRELRRKLILQPGPNNPVGTVWIGLDRPGYGIHGTPRPEQVGRTESHGCFRLANWNASYLAKMSWVGMPVFVEP